MFIFRYHHQEFPTGMSWVEPIFYLWLSTYEAIHYKCFDFSHWLKHHSAIDREWQQGKHQGSALLALCAGNPPGNLIITLSAVLTSNRPISQIPQCIRQISHNATFCNRNVHMRAHFCYKMLHCGIWHRCILGFVKWVYYIMQWAGLKLMLFFSQSLQQLMILNIYSSWLSLKSIKDIFQHFIDSVTPLNHLEMSSFWLIFHHWQYMKLSK